MEEREKEEEEEKGEEKVEILRSKERNKNLCVDEEDLFVTNWFITVAFCIVGRFATVPVSTEFREIRFATDTKKKELW
jgi:hypothetical protein